MSRILVWSYKDFVPKGVNAIPCTGACGVRGKHWYYGVDWAESSPQPDGPGHGNFDVPGNFVSAAPCRPHRWDNGPLFQTKTPLSSEEWQELLERGAVARPGSTAAPSQDQRSP